VHGGGETFEHRLLEGNGRGGKAALFPLGRRRPKVPMVCGAQPDPLAAVVVLPAQGGRRPHGPKWATRPSGAGPEWPKGAGPAR
jgi:hypothetical protein